MLRSSIDSSTRVSRTKLANLSLLQPSAQLWDRLGLTRTCWAVQGDLVSLAVSRHPPGLELAPSRTTLDQEVAGLVPLRSPGQVHRLVGCRASAAVSLGLLLFHRPATLATHLPTPLG